MLENYNILEWDSNFFGFKVAQIISNSEDYSACERTLNELKKCGVQLVYWQVERGSSVASELSSKYNGKLVDLKTTFSYTHTGQTIYCGNENVHNYNVTFAEDDILNLAVQCGSFSRFFVDERIAKEKATELYRIWIKKSVSHEIADNVIVYKKNNQIVGLITLQIKDGRGNIGLVGVDENYRGLGIATELMKASLVYFATKQVLQVDVVTQGLNLPACKLYEKAGFNISLQKDFYHFWIL